MKSWKIRVSASVAVLLLTALAPGAGAAGSVTTARVSVTHTGAQADRPSGAPSVSADGRYVAFLSDSAQIISGDTNNAADVFLLDRRTGSLQRISVNSSANESRFTDPTKAPNSWPSVTAGGRYVAFSSGAWNLVSGDTNELSDIFVRDRVAGTTVRASIGLNGSQPNGPSVKPAISDDGRFVAFESTASNLVPNDTNGAPDIFLRDLQAGTTKRVSVRWDNLEVPKGGYGVPAISADGRFVAFHSVDRLHPYDQNGIVDVYVFDRDTATVEPASLDSTGTFAEGNTWDDIVVADPVIGMSSDGRYVAFESGTPTLVPGDTNAVRDIFVRDRTGATTKRVSLSASGRQLSGASRTPSVSDDGRFVAFVSDARDGVGGDNNASADVFVRDLQLGTTQRASVTGGGGEANNASSAAAISADGTAIVFASLATNLVQSDTNAVQDVFARGVPLDPPPSAPTIGNPTENATVRSTQVAIAGAAGAGTTVRVIEGNAVIASTTTSSNGTWSVTAELSDGAHRVFAVASRDGIESDPSTLRTFFINANTGVLRPPTISSPQNGSVLNKIEVTVLGSADPNVDIAVTDAGAIRGTTRSDGSGSWSVPIACHEGTHSIVAVASDGTMQASSEPRNFSVDLTPPPAPAITGPASGETVYASPARLTGTAEPNATVTVYRDGAPNAMVMAGPTGSWAANVNLVEGENLIVARARDVAGNLSPTSAWHVVTLRTDTAPPTTTFNGLAPYNAYGPGNPPVIDGTAQDNVKVVAMEMSVRTLQNAEIAKPPVTCDGCGTPNVSWRASPILGPGAYRVYVYAYDAAGLRSQQNFITIVRV